MEHLSSGSGSGDIASIDSASFRVRFKRNVLISFAVLLAAIGLAYRPGLGDLPLARLVNSFANRSPALDGLFYDFDDYFTFSGVILVALIWSCWFKSRDLEIRARLLVATLISIGCGYFGTTLQAAGYRRF